VDWGISEMHVNLQLVLLFIILWKHRNDIKLGNNLSSEEHILKRIDWEVRTCVMGFGKLGNTEINRRLSCRMGSTE